MTVYLVGAGPGDPGLISARALELIARAEVVLYDRLIPRELLERAPPGAKLIYAGKGGASPSTEQAEITRLLVEHGRAGRLVVRLKGGDPFVFGRGGEEAQALREAGVPFEVVPGVTAGVAAPAYAGIPVTHRGLASAVAFVTAHEDPAKPGSSLDWDALAAFPGTLVLYMGVRRLAEAAGRLVGAGRSPAEPAAVIERGTEPGQRVVTGRLGDIATRAAEAGVAPPALTVVGEVVALRDSLAWFGSRPLAGFSVAVTRARAQASELAARLRELGAEVVQAPAIRTVSLEVPLPDLARYDVICLTSPSGVHLLFERLAAAGRDARALAGATVAAIGPGTAAALREHGVIADVVPERSVAEGLLEALLPRLAGRPAGRALVARAAEARDVLPHGLRRRGIETDVLALYRTVPEPLSEEQLAAVRAADYVTFTSSSTVRHLLRAAGDGGVGRARVVSIGPVTSATLREHGLEPDVEASRHDIDGVVEALLADAAQKRTSAS